MGASPSAQTVPGSLAGHGFVIIGVRARCVRLPSHPGAARRRHGAGAYPSILLDEAGSARGFEPVAQLVRIALHAERANLRGVEDAPFALILATNQQLAATQHRILRLHRAK